MPQPSRRTVSLATASRPALAGIVAVATLVLMPGLAKATTITDPAGDFLATFTGPHNGDMDVLAVGAVDSATQVTLTANLAGPIGTTPGGIYVIGVNRGAGQPLLTFGTPSVGAGVNFDAVIVLNPAGGSVVNLLLPTAQPPQPLSSVTFSGSSFTAVVPFSLLPSNGFAPAQYLYNLWPRNGLGSNVQISDFAPNASSFAASAPEPGAWALMLLGFGALGAALRLRRGRLAPA